MMFVHGRESYRRIAIVIGFTFFKNALITLSILYFGVVSGFSAQTLYEPIVQTLYELTVELVPDAEFATNDEDKSKRILL